MNNTSLYLSSRGTREFFTAVKGNNILKELNIAINAITDDACDIIIAEEQLFGYTGHVWQSTDSMPSGHSGELYYILDLNVQKGKESRGYYVKSRGLAITSLISSSHFITNICKSV